ncbi:hypothetical protein CPC08DRAFT_705146 [Agrocybe pediades]|nr:hypothetical protein CPC08DRAFT_705146 [Agrocybe pediades]
MFRLTRFPLQVTRLPAANFRGLASSALLSRSWQNETLAELRNEAKNRGLSTKGAKSALIARLEEYEKNHVASPSPAGIRQVSSTASPAEPPASAEVPGNPEQSSSSVSVPFWDIKMPDLSQPEPVEPIRIPFVPDFWDSSALEQPSGPKEETLPKIVVVAGANTHRGGGPSHNFVDASEDGHQEQTSSTQATTASSRSGSLLDDIAEDLGLPPVQDIKSCLRRLF